MNKHVITLNIIRSCGSQQTKRAVRSLRPAPSRHNWTGVTVFSFLLFVDEVGRVFFVENENVTRWVFFYPRIFFPGDIRSIFFYSPL